MGTLLNTTSLEHHKTEPALINPKNQATPATSGRRKLNNEEKIQQI